MELGRRGLENLISEALKPKQDRTGAWVSGTMGLDLNNSITLEVQIMVPKPEHDDLQRESINNGWGFPEPEAGIQPFIDPEKFIDLSLRSGVVGRDIREWCRVYSVHNSPLADGICQSMDETLFDVWVRKWREMGYSRDEGAWLGGSARHMTHHPDCPWCVARFKKGIATGSPYIPAPPLTADYTKRLLRDKKDLGRACGDPVRPLKFTIREIGREDAVMDVRGAKRSKLWFTRQNKMLARKIMYKYEGLVLEAIKKRLSIPTNSDIYGLVFGPMLNEHDIWPSNFEYKIINDAYIKTNFGRVPELQGLQFSSYSHDAPGLTFKERQKTKDGYLRSNKSYVDLGDLEMHFIYNYVVEIDLTASPPERDRYGNKAPSVETTPGSFLEILTSKIREGIKKGPEFHSYWVDSGGNAFTIEKYQTGLDGLNFMIDPFMPEKNTDNRDKSIPAFSPAHYMGGRSDRIAVDTVAEWISNFDLTLAPFDQYTEWPIGSDGTIYTVKESKVFVLNDGTHVVGEISEKESNDREIVIRRLHLSDQNSDKDQDIAYETPFTTRTRSIQSENIVIPINLIRDQVTLEFDEYDYDDLALDYSSPEKLAQYFEEAKSDLSELLPPDEYLNKLEKERGPKFVDIYGIINPKDLNAEYSWRDPVLWSKELLTSLMTPFPVTDEQGSFMIKKNGRYEYVEEGSTFAWNVIENPGHPEYPYVNEADNIIPVIQSKRLKSMLESRGDYFNQTTQQWEGQHRVNFYNADGVLKYKWIPYNESAFWAHVPHLKFPEYVASLRRTSAWAQSMNKVAEIARLKGEVKKWTDNTFRPTKQVMGKEVDAKRKSRTGKKVNETKLRSESFEMTYWSKEWFQANMQRLKKGIFPSPTHSMNPPAQFWDTVNNKPANYRKGMGRRKAYWPCRICEGAGCNRCLKTEYAKEYPPPGNVDPDNPIKFWLRNREQYTTRDLWSGSEWISYLKAQWAMMKFKFKDEGEDEDEEEKKEKSLNERKYRIRDRFNSLFKQYDYYCLIDKIKREPEQPIDLSDLSALDKTMLIINFGGEAPRIINDEERDAFITGMIAVNTELFHGVLPPDLKDWYLNNTVDGGRARPDVLMNKVSELRNFEKESDEIVQATPEIRKELEEKIKKSHQESLNDNQTTSIDDKVKSKPERKVRMTDEEKIRQILDGDTIESGDSNSDNQDSDPSEYPDRDPDESSDYDGDLDDQESLQGQDGAMEQWLDDINVDVEADDDDQRSMPDDPDFEDDDFNPDDSDGSYTDEDWDD